MWFLVIKRVHFSQLKLVAKNDRNDHHVNGRFQEKFDPHGSHWLHWSPDPLLRILATARGNKKFQNFLTGSFNQFDLSNKNNRKQTK